MNSEAGENMMLPEGGVRRRRVLRLGTLVAAFGGITVLSGLDDGQAVAALLPAATAVATLNKSGDLAVAPGTTKYPLPGGTKIIDVVATLGTTSVTRSVKITPKLDGKAIFGTQPEIPAGATASQRITADLITGVAAGGGMLTCDVDQVGATGNILYINSTTATTTWGTILTVTKPVGTQPGDVLLVAVYVDKAGVTVAPSAGWAQIGTATILPSGQSLSVFWFRTDLEPGPYYFSFSASAFTRAASLAYRGCVTAGSPIAASATSTNTAFSTTIFSPSVAAPADCRLVHISGIPQHPATVTLDSRVMARVAVGNYLITDDEQWDAASTTGTRMHTLSASGNSANMSIALRPANVDGTGKDMVVAVRYQPIG